MNEGNVNGWAEISGKRHDGIIAAAAPADAGEEAKQPEGRCVR